MAMRLQVSEGPLVCIGLSFKFPKELALDIVDLDMGFH